MAGSSSLVLFGTLLFWSGLSTIEAQTNEGRCLPVQSTMATTICVLTTNQKLAANGRSNSTFCANMQELQCCLNREIVQCPQRKDDVISFYASNVLASDDRTRAESQCTPCAQYIMAGNWDGCPSKATLTILSPTSCLLVALVTFYCGTNNKESLW